MASRDGAEGRQFPVQLAQGLLQDLYLKEIGALLHPTDEGHQASFEAAKASLPRRLALLDSQMSGLSDRSILQGISDLTGRLWQLIREPMDWQDCVWMDALDAVFKAACSKSEWATEILCDGSLLVTQALTGYAVSTKDDPETRVDKPQLLALFKWWGDEVCCKRWGVTNAWGFCEIGELRLNPLFIICKAGLAPLVPFALERGCDVNGDFSNASTTSPAVLAYVGGYGDVLDILLDSGIDLVRPYKKNGWPAVITMLLVNERNVALFEEVLRRRPEVLEARAGLTAPIPFTLLGAAIQSGNAAVVDLVLSAGAPIEHGIALDGNRLTRCPSLAAALGKGRLDILKLLAAKGKVFENWEDKYNKEALGHISWMLAQVAVSAFPSNPDFEGDPTDLVEYNAEAAECLEFVAASGIVSSWDRHDNNCMLQRLYPYGKSGGCTLVEEHALELLQRLRSFGFNVSERYAPFKSVGGDKLPAGFDLAICSIYVGHPTVTDWAIKTFRLPLDGLGPGQDGSLLSHSLSNKSIACAKMLVTKYSARVSVRDPGASLAAQPVVNLLQAQRQYSDDEFLEALRMLVERDRGLFDLPCFGEAAIAELEAKRKTEMELLCWNPVFLLVNPPKPRSLEYLLKSNLPGVAAMANRPVSTAVPYYGGFSRQHITAAQVAAGQMRWECLDLLLRYTDTKVTRNTEINPSAWEVVQATAGQSCRPPRAVYAAMEARAKKELAAKAAAAKAKPAATVASGATASNAFEDPSLKLVSESEAKKKAKKRAAKKKAKAKKRAAANAGAGGTAVADSSSDDDDNEEDACEDLDDNLVDSRNAPSLDLMLEQMGLKNGMDGKATGGKA